MRDLAKIAGRGIAWSFLGQTAQQGIQFLTIIILARLLGPADFGMFGMAMILANFLRPLQEWGFQTFLIQKKDINQEYANTALWSMIILGCGLFIISIIAAPFIASYFNDQKMSRLIMAIALGFLLNPVGAIQWALANRELRFKNLAVVDIAMAMVYGFSACSLALKGFGVWALVIATLARDLLWSVIFWFISHWRPKFNFSMTRLREMIAFSANCTGSATLNYTINNIDNLAVGKYLGAANLGFYSLAFNTVTYPQNKIFAYAESVAFPVFSLMRDEKERLRDIYLKTVKMILLVITPIIAVLFISAKEFVLTLYGEKWLFAVIPIKIMCFYGLVNAILFMSGSVFLSKGRADIDFKANILKLILLAALLVFGLRYGITGVSTTLLLYSICIFFPVSYWQNKLIGLDNFKFYSEVLRYITVYFLIICVIWRINAQWFLQHDMPFAQRLALKVSLGVAAYLFSAVTLLKKDFAIFIGVIKKTFS